MMETPGPGLEPPADIPAGRRREVREVDWQSVEDAYRSGTTLRTIGALHGISHTAVKKRAVAEGWSRDLSAQVRAATRAKLVSSPVSAEVSAESAEREREVIDKELEIRARLIRGHQKRLGKLHASADKLGERFDLVFNGHELDLPCRGERESPADCLGKIIKMTATLISLERQAFAVDEPADLPGEGSMAGTEWLMAELAGIARRVTATDIPPDAPEQGGEL